MIIADCPCCFRPVFDHQKICPWCDEAIGTLRSNPNNPIPPKKERFRHREAVTHDFYMDAEKELNYE